MASSADRSLDPAHFLMVPTSPEDALSMETSIDYTSKNRESVQLELEKKLKCRSGRDHLVQLNILPAVSTAPVLLAQSHKLQRQQTADSLQQKLRDRVSRNELYQRNILPDSKLFLDPSLSATQKQLQKKRIADNLNVKISNRPGVLELVEGHIIEPHLSRALETYLHDPEGSDETRPPTLTTPSPTSSSLSLSFQSNEARHDYKFSDSTSPILSPGELYRDDQKSPSVISALEDVPTPPPPPPVTNLKYMRPPGSSHHPCKAPSPSQVRKRHHKPKYRKLRYHEYIPPSKSGAKGGKTNSVSKPPSQSDTPYSLLLQQQQLFLQLQVLQQQYPNGVLVQKLPELMKNMPASLTEKAQAMLKPKTAGMENIRPLTKTHEIPEDIKVRSPAVGNNTITMRLDELKVNVLKSACKEQNLMVSGKKVELIERLLEHNNGVLPASVLTDNSTRERRQSLLGQSASVDSSYKSNSTSPQSPDQDTLFQFPGRSQSVASSQPMDTGSNIGSPMVSGLEFQQHVDRMIEKKKIEFLSASGPKTVAPKPDLSKLLSVNHQFGDAGSSSSFKHSRSLPTTPQQLSPATSSDNILHELMEQSPKPHPINPQQSHKSPDPLVYHNPHLSQSGGGTYTQRRSGRASLPNPPPYPGAHNPNFLPSDLAGSGHFASYHQHSHLMNQRSVSLSGPSTNGHSIKSNGMSEHLAAFSNEDNIGLNELMEMETDLTDFNALFKILEKDESGHTSALAQSHQSMSFDHATTQSISHTDSAQSDNVMFGVQGLKSASLDFLPTIESTHESTKIPTSNGSQNHFNDLGGMLNLEHSLLGSSPHLQGYFPDSHNMQTQYDYYQGNGPVDDIGFKPSTNGLTDLNTSLDSQNQLDQFGMLNGGGLFGTSDNFLDMNLTS